MCQIECPIPIPIPSLEWEGAFIRDRYGMAALVLAGRNCTHPHPVPPLEWEGALIRDRYGMTGLGSGGP